MSLQQTEVILKAIEGILNSIGYAIINYNIEKGYLKMTLKQVELPVKSKWQNSHFSKQLLCLVLFNYNIMFFRYFTVFLLEKWLSTKKEDIFSNKIKKYFGRGGIVDG